MVVVDRPSCVAGRVANSSSAQGRISDAQHAEFCRHAFKVQGHAIKVDVGRASGQRRSHGMQFLIVRREQLPAQAG